MDQCTVQQANQWEWEAIQKLLLSRLKSQWEAKKNRSFQQNLTIQLNPALTDPPQTEFLLWVVTDAN